MKLIADNHDEPSNEELGIRPHRGYILTALIGLVIFWTLVGLIFS
ncbi:MAG: hypothetical protein V3T23_05705 [Nitrososphaerales archaeon]